MKTTNTFVDEDLWKLIQNEFPSKVQERLNEKEVDDPGPGMYYV